MTAGNDEVLGRHCFGCFVPVRICILTDRYYNWNQQHLSANRRLHQLKPSASSVLRCPIFRRQQSRTQPKQNSRSTTPTFLCSVPSYGNDAHASTSHCCQETSLLRRKTYSDRVNHLMSQLCHSHGHKRCSTTEKESLARMLFNGRERLL
ncbi:uncharacterized protein LOC133178119 [Saccostrea echinata]|uniref:uncharacterized protein LOC133178119 n=1 Tax=Saccostrea echinata TaxID=191078 RepID=UPI002A8345C7|nr:uncharacterized protein LOC133178119 [Saccostrea echinata]